MNKPADAFDAAADWLLDLPLGLIDGSLCLGRQTDFRPVPAVEDPPLSREERATAQLIVAGFGATLLGATLP